MVYACFVLHNFCEKNNTSIDDELVKSRQIQVAAAAQDKDIPDPVFSCNSSEGKAVRDINVLKYVGLNLPDDLIS